MSLYSDLREDADSLLDEFEAMTMTLHHITATSYDAVKGENVFTSTDYSIKGVKLNYKQSVIDGSLIQYVRASEKYYS